MREEREERDRKSRHPSVEPLRASGGGSWTVVNLVLGVLLLLASVWIIVDPGAFPPALGFLPPSVLGLVGTAIFGTSTAFSAWRLVDRKPLLEIGPGGIVDRRAGFGREIEVPWSEVEDVRRGQRGALEIRLRDPGFVLEQVGPLRRLQMKLWSRGGRSPFQIDTSGLDAPADDVEARLREVLDERLLREAARERARLDRGEG